MNTAESIELWKKRFSDRKLTGQKVDIWCEKNNISRHAYYYWHRKIQNSKQMKEKKDTFVEVSIPSSEAVPISENRSVVLFLLYNFSLEWIHF